MTKPLVRQWLDAGELNLPLPASGDTFGRWLKLAEFTEVDVVAAGWRRSPHRRGRDPRRTRRPRSTAVGVAPSRPHVEDLCRRR
jgi:hypothetical protein